VSCYSGEVSDLASATVERLVRLATEVRQRAYAPYSGYRVGAAALAADGRVFTGCNVENASYGLSVCAERHAVAAAVAAGARELLALAVVTAGPEPAPPCGACRQVLAELGVPVVILATPGTPARVLELAALLPHPFGARHL